MLHDRIAVKGVVKNNELITENEKFKIINLIMCDTEGYFLIKKLENKKIIIFRKVVK